MNCLECTAMMRAAYTVRGAIGCCVHCGAGICLDHARILARPAQPVGVVPRSRGARRVMCATCYTASRPKRRRACHGAASIQEPGSEDISSFPVLSGCGPAARSVWCCFPVGRLAARCLVALVSGASRGGTLRASSERLKVRAAALTGAGAEP